MRKKSNIQIFPSVPAPVLNVAVAICLSYGAALARGAAHAAPDAVRDATARENVPAPPEGDGLGIIVRMELPWDVLLKRENITFDFILDNRSEAAIPVAFPEGEPFGWPNGGQAFLEGFLRPGAPGPGPINSGLRWLKVQDADWPPRDAENEAVNEWGKLAAGQRVVWNSNQLRAREYFRIYSTEFLLAVQGHWLVGKGRWVSSEPVAVEVRDVPENQWVKVFEGEWSSYGRGLDTNITRVMKIPLDGKWFLFSDFMCRICEVGEKDEFEFKIEPEIGQLVVSVKSPAGEKKHYYHMQHGLTRDIPWKAGPVSQYYPVPEPIPEADLALPVLATKVATNGEKPSSTSAVDAAARSRWPWVLGALLLVLAFAGAWVLYSRGRKA